MREIKNNKKFVDEMRKVVDMMMSQMIGDMISMSGMTIDELDPEYVIMYNKYMKKYKEIWDLYESWAEYQDDANNKQIEKLDKIIELLEKKSK